MKSAESLSLRDMAAIADAAHGLGLNDAAVILIEALYNRFDRKPVDDLSSVVELVRRVAFTHERTASLKLAQSK